MTRTPAGALDVGCGRWARVRCEARDEPWPLGGRRSPSGPAWLRLPLLVLTLTTGCGEGADSGVTARSDFPPPRPVTSASVTPEDFVGAEACAECHREQYAAWSGSTHGRAGGAPGPDVVVAAFDGRPIRFADATVTPRVRGDAYEFVVDQEGFPDTVYTVAGVIGGAHMLGGGTQGFLTRWPDGTERFLPWDWSGASSQWFCNTSSRANRGWEPITPEMRLADCGDWPPVRPIGTVSRFANCQECHGSQIRTTLEPGVGYRTEYTSLSVNCESCHGPGRAHLEAARAGRGTEVDPAIASLAYLDKDASLDTCFRCHALKDVLREGYLPGEPLERFYALKYPTLGDQPLVFDGRVRTFAYQGNHLASACYLQGPMDCVSCHEPHGQGYWDIERRPLGGPYDDGQCTGCHPSKIANPEEHTFHPAGSEGSACVACHMPYLQHPDVGDGIRFARSDHTISIPRPAFDASLGIESACRRCHADLSPSDLGARVREWWGETKPHRPTVAGLAGEFRARSLEEAAALLLHPEVTDPLIQFQALARLLTVYLRPDTELPDSVLDDLRALASGDDLDVRSLALATLHWTRGDAPEVHGDLVRALEGAPDDDALRSRWVAALGYLGDEASGREDLATAELAYGKALALRPGDPDLLHALGRLYTRRAAYDLAASALRGSLETEPAQPLVWVNLGIALAESGDPGGARTAYGEALAINPFEALAHFNLGNLHQRAGRLEDAAESYARAVESDPGLGRGHFELGRTLIRLERFEGALAHARRAVEFMPDHEPSRQMLADLERGLGR